MGDFIISPRKKAFAEKRLDKDALAHIEAVYPVDVGHGLFAGIQKRFSDLRGLKVTLRGIPSHIGSSSNS